MNPEAQRIAIAEACGWKRNGHISWFHPKHGQRTSANNIMPDQALPDYLSDLNAMHEAEKVLTRDQRHEFIEQLRAILNNLNRADRLWNGATAFDYCHATAAQRAEALLCTLNLWKLNPTHPNA